MRYLQNLKNYAVALAIVPTFAFGTLAFAQDTEVPAEPKPLVEQVVEAVETQQETLEMDYETALSSLENPVLEEYVQGVVDHFVGQIETADVPTLLAYIGLNNTLSTQLEENAALTTVIVNYVVDTDDLVGLLTNAQAAATLELTLYQYGEWKEEIEALVMDTVAPELPEYNTEGVSEEIATKYEALAEIVNAERAAALETVTGPAQALYEAFLSDLTEEAALTDYQSNGIGMLMLGYILTDDAYTQLQWDQITVDDIFENLDLYLNDNAKELIGEVEPGALIKEAGAVINIAFYMTLMEHTQQTIDTMTAGYDELTMALYQEMSENIIPLYEEMVSYYGQMGAGSAAGQYAMQNAPSYAMQGVGNNIVGLIKMGVEETLYDMLE